MDGDTIHAERETQICGEDNGFRHGHIDLEEPHPSGVSTKQFIMQFIRAFRAGDTALGVIATEGQCGGDLNLCFSSHRLG